VDESIVCIICRSGARLSGPAGNRYNANDYRGRALG